MKEKEFANILLKWFESHHRPMPWKGVKNPYLIWLSEIILQQTRVEQGLPYFEKFAAKYPTITDLANAPEDEVMKLWQGLGYYSRARNLHFTAKYIADELNGIFPKNYKDILKLKGVGTYTAAAIASFAYDLPYAVLDGNVYRVLARIYGIETPIDTTEGKKKFSELAQNLIAEKQAAHYNQAIMDFGATQCTPQNPNCTSCPFQANCIAFEKKTISKLPIKSKKLKKKTRYFNYLVLNWNEKTWLKKRAEKDIWQNLYEFPMIETEQPFDLETLQLSEAWRDIFPKDAIFTIKKVSPPFQQMLTHRKIIATFLEINVENSIKETGQNNLILISKKDVLKYAFPKVISRFLEDKSLYLELF